MIRKFIFEVYLAATLAACVSAQVSITNVGVTAQTSTSATIAWNSSGPATTQILFGLTSTNLNSVTPKDFTLVTSHTATITGLVGLPAYGVIYYSAQSVDGSNNTTTSPVQSFELCAGNGFTNISGNALPYYLFGTWTITWINQSGQTVTPKVCGQPIATSYTGTLDGTGSFSTSIPDNLQITPSPSQWQVTVNAVGNIGVFNSLPVTIFGPSANVSPSLQAGVPGHAIFVEYDQATNTFYPPISSAGSLAAINGTLNQINSSTVGNIATLSLPSNLVTPGPVSVTGDMTASGTVFGNSVAVTGPGAVTIIGSCGALPPVTANNAGIGFGPGCVPQQNINGAGWTNFGSGSGTPAWNNVINPTGNQTLSFGTNLTTWTLGDLGNGGSSFVISDTSVSTTPSNDLMLATGVSSRNKALRVQAGGVDQLQVTCWQAGPFYAVIIGHGVTCPNLTTSPPVKLLVQIPTNDSTHQAARFFEASTGYGTSLVDFNTLTPAGTAFSFWRAQTGCSGTDTGCGSGVVAASLRGDGLLSLASVAATGSVTGTSLKANGAGAGLTGWTQGADNSSACPVNSECHEANSSIVNSYTTIGPSAGPSALSIRTSSALSAGKSNEGFASLVGSAGSGIPTMQASPSPIIISSSTSIGSTSLCSTVLCPAGTYTVNAYLDITTACGTSGTYLVNLIYTDDQGSRTVPVNFQGNGAVPATGVITTTSTANFGQVSQVVRTTGAASINYSTTAVACGSVGPMAGNLYLSAVRVQ